jgi:uncharacterized membrane protein
VIGRLDAAIEDSFFLVLIGVTSLTLLLSSTSVSSYLPPGDINQEVNLLLKTLSTGRWDAASNELYNISISISILPSLLSIVAALDAIQVLKFIYPVLFVTVPVMLYKVYRAFLSPKWAFLSVFLFMSYETFYWELTHLGRQEIGEILLVLLLWHFLSGKKLVSSRIGVGISIMLLTAGLITAHYSLVYIYFVAVAVSYLASKISPRTDGVSALSMQLLVLSATLALSWYSFIASESALSTLNRFLSTVINGLVRDFFDPTSRPLVILQAAGLASVVPGLLHDLNRGTQYLVVFLLAVGFAVLIRKRSKSVAERRMIPLMTVAFCLLGVAVAFPFFAGGLNLTRIYHIALLFVSPCFMYGAEKAQSVLRALHGYLCHRGFGLRLRSIRWLFPAIILVSYFLFNSGWVWAVSMDTPTSAIFDGQRMLSSSNAQLKNDSIVDYFVKFSVGQDVDAARWVGHYFPNNQTVCTDTTSRIHPLNSYAWQRISMFVDTHGGIHFSNNMQFYYCDLKTSYVFFSVMNTIYGIATKTDPAHRYYSVSDFRNAVLVTKNRIYSNGGSEVYA